MKLTEAGSGGFEKKSSEEQFKDWENGLAEESTEQLKVELGHCYDSKSGRIKMGLGDTVEALEAEIEKRQEQK